MQLSMTARANPGMTGNGMRQYFFVCACSCSSTANIQLCLQLGSWKTFLRKELNQIYEGGGVVQVGREKAWEAVTSPKGGSRKSKLFVTPALEQMCPGRHWFDQTKQAGSPTSVTGWVTKVCKTQWGSHFPAAGSYGNMEELRTQRECHGLRRQQSGQLLGQWPAAICELLWGLGDIQVEP